MRLSDDDIEALKRLARETWGEGVELRLFGSRVDDTARGGDVDLFVEVASPTREPAWSAATFAARASRAIGGRKVDVVIAAPNLAAAPIHAIARQQGVRL